MLETNPEYRASARTALLTSKWLKTETDYDFKFTDDGYMKYKT